MVEEIFNPDDPKYLCCCGCHVTTGTKIICYISFFFVLLSGLLGLGGMGSPDFIIAAFILTAITSFIFLSPIYGIHKQQPGWLLPYLVLSGVGIGLTVLSIIFLFVALIQVAVDEERLGENDREPMLEQMSYDNFSDFDVSKLRVFTLFFLLVDNFISLGLGIWCRMIVYRCYQYLVERKNVKYVQVMYSPTAVIVNN